MGARRHKKRADPNNKRLDLFLTQLKIEQEKKEKILQYVEELTFNTLKEKARPNLRLNQGIRRMDLRR